MTRATRGKLLSGTLDADYETYFQIVDASEWVPQRRKRVFIVCFDKTVFGRPDELRFSFPDNKTDHGPTLGSILESVPDDKYMLSDKLGLFQNYAKKHAEKVTVSGLASTILKASLELCPRGITKTDQKY